MFSGGGSMPWKPPQSSAGAWLRRAAPKPMVKEMNQRWTVASPPTEGPQTRTLTPTSIEILILTNQTLMVAETPTRTPIPRSK